MRPLSTRVTRIETNKYWVIIPTLAYHLPDAAAKKSD
jgi:hypothetical protein